MGTPWTCIPVGDRQEAKVLYNTSVEVRASGKVKQGQEKEGIEKREVRRTAGCQTQAQSTEAQAQALSFSWPSTLLSNAAQKEPFYQATPAVAELAVGPDPTPLPLEEQLISLRVPLHPYLPLLLHQPPLRLLFPAAGLRSYLSLGRQQHLQPPAPTL